MAILRSRTSSGETRNLPNPGVARALASWDERVEAAKSIGRAEMEAQLEQEIASANGRIEAAQQEAQDHIAAAKAEWEDQWRQAFTTLQNTVALLKDRQSRFIAEAEQDCLHLALAIASRVLRREVQVDRTWMDEVLKETCVHLPEREGVRIRVHPQDAEALQGRIADLLPAGMDLPEILADPTLDAGACQVESGGTLLDVGIAISWERLATALQQTAPHERAVAEESWAAMGEGAAAPAAGPAQAEADEAKLSTNGEHGVVADLEQSEEETEAPGETDPDAESEDKA